MATNKQPTAVPPITRPCRLLDTRLVQNFHLVWLDRSIDETNDDCCSSITKLREVVNTVTTFVDVDQCIDFITDIEETTFMVISGEFSQTLIPIILDIVQVSSIYIFCKNNLPYEKWLKECPLVSGVYTDITFICQTLKQTTKDCDHNSLSISVLKKVDGVAKESLDTIDCSFMYTQILKEILLTLNFNEGHFKEFLTYCRQQLAGNSIELRNVDKIENEYCLHKPIWWYTYQCFLFSMLNRALRTMQVDLIVSMGFFVRDLHNHIAELHTQQYCRKKQFNSFIVYRGQGLSQIDFDPFKTTQGGLLAFNNFLSTSLKSDVSLRFARDIIKKSNLVGVLFVMEIDPSISGISFANVSNVSRYKGEEEILFSMHSVFRITAVQQIENNERLWEVNLTLTSDNDPQLQILTKIMENETAGATGWFRLGRLMRKVAQFDKAQHIFDMILDQTADEIEKGHIYQEIGQIKYEQGKHRDAITYFENLLKIQQKTLPAGHPSLAASYNNIGSVYMNMSEYSKALSYYEQALETRRKTLPASHPDLATYNNIGSVYMNMGEYSKALSYYEQALEIEQKTLPASHPSLATSYNNIGSVYMNMGEYSKALSYYEQALEIEQKTLPASHPSLATSYNNIGSVYMNMGEYSKSLSYYEQALEIRQKSLPASHPALATSYNNIGSVYDNMGEYTKALSYYEQALEIKQKTLPASHPDLATSYNNIGSVYDNMGEYTKALSYYEQALEIKQKTLPASHPSLATSYSNIGLVYDNMGEYSKALSYYGQTLEIRQKTLPADHPSLATSYNNIGSVYMNMGEYTKALSYYEQALEIEQKTLPAGHPSLATSYNNIGSVYYTLNKFSEALSYCEHALQIFQRSLPPNHPHLKMVKQSIEAIKKKL